MGFRFLYAIFVSFQPLITSSIDISTWLRMNISKSSYILYIPHRAYTMSLDLEPRPPFHRAAVAIKVRRVKLFKLCFISSSGGAAHHSPCLPGRHGQNTTTPYLPTLLTVFLSLPPPLPFTHPHTFNGTIYNPALPAPPHRTWSL